MALQLVEEIGGSNCRFHFQLVRDEGSFYVLVTDQWDMRRQSLTPVTVRSNYATDVQKIVREQREYLNAILSGAARPPIFGAREYEVEVPAVLHH